MQKLVCFEILSSRLASESLPDTVSSVETGMVIHKRLEASLDPTVRFRFARDVYWYLYNDEFRKKPCG